MLSLFSFKLVYLQSFLAISYVDIVLVDSDVVSRLTFANMCKNLWITSFQCTSLQNYHAI